jgi:hypothetical protein
MQRVRIEAISETDVAAATQVVCVRRRTQPSLRNRRPNPTHSPARPAPLTHRRRPMLKFAQGSGQGCSSGEGLAEIPIQRIQPRRLSGARVSPTNIPFSLFDGRRAEVD